MRLILGTGEALTPDELLAKAAQADLFAPKVKPAPAGQASLFGQATPALAMTQGEQLPVDRKRTRSTQFYLGPRGGKWADLEHTIPWTGEGGGGAGRTTTPGPGAQDVSLAQHEN